MFARLYEQVTVGRDMKRMARQPGPPLRVKPNPHLLLTLPKKLFLWKVKCRDSNTNDGGIKILSTVVMSQMRMMVIPDYPHARVQPEVLRSL